MSVITTLDFDAVYRQVQAKKQRAKRRRTYAPFIRLWDGRWRLRGRVTRYDESTFEVIDGDTGIGVLEMPHDYYLSRWLTNVEVKGTNPRVKR
ncbi:Gp37-like protein, partial [Nocardia gipuzkoensis]